MADKQLARNGDADFDFFAEGDPLAELARIVGYDNRPAMQQLQELERHRETIRQEPVVNLEDELLREFDVYDAPKAVEPVNAPEAPVVEAAETLPVEQVAFIEERAPVAEAAQPAVAYTVANFREEPEIVTAPTEDFGFDGLELERELELSIGYDDDVQSPFSDDVASTFSQHEDNVAAPVATVVEVPAARIEAPVEMQAAIAAAPAATTITPQARPAGDVDSLLADIERYPVPPVAGQKTPLPQDAGRKVNYPFTPSFSRATPVASNGGVLSQKAFATPLPAAAPLEAPVTEVAYKPAELPVEPVVVEAAPALKAPIEADVEQDLDLDNFELDLSDIELDMDASDFEAMTVEPSPVATVAPQPVAAQPAPASTEPVRQQFEEQVSETQDIDLPFDPSMIAEAEETVTPIHDLNVPQLPPVEQERPVAQQPDYDLDIDAEMAQLFGATSTAAVASMAMGKTGATAQQAAADDFDEFERAMEEDFRRSLTQRQTADPESDRLSVGSGYDATDSYDEGRGSGRRRLALMAAAVAGIAVLGGVGVYAFTGKSGASFNGGEPQVILADKSPVKMVPVEKGGKTVPNQDKAVYDRVAGGETAAPQQGALVSSTEEPIDVVQRTLTPENLPDDGFNDDLPGVLPMDSADERLMPDDGSAASARKADDTPAVSPRKVRTMIVRPDGTLVAREETVADDQQVASTGDPAVRSVKTTSIPSVQTGTTPAPAAAEQTPLEQAASATVEETAPVRPVKTAALAEATPAPAAAPAEQRQVVDTFKTPAATAPAAEAAPVQTAAVAPGTYVIQIASLPSEADAQRSYQNLSSKFGSVIGGKGVDIRKAEIAGKGTYYRVRIPAGTRDEANSLCSRYKSAGGSCLVTR